VLLYFRTISGVRSLSRTTPYDDDGFHHAIVAMAKDLLIEDILRRIYGIILRLGEFLVRNVVLKRHGHTTTYGFGGGRQVAPFWLGIPGISSA
jgi:hypothetical protein